MSLHENLTKRERQDRAHEEAERWVDEATEDDCTCPLARSLWCASIPDKRIAYMARLRCPIHGDREAAVKARAEELMDTPDDEPEYDHA